MATDIGTGVATEATNNKIAMVVELLNEVNPKDRKWKTEDVIKLEKDLQVLNTDFSRMKGLLIEISNRFLSRQRRLPNPVERCLERIKDALGEPRNLIDGAKRQQERGWCLPCRRPLSSKITVWKARFDALLQELEMAFSISSKAEQIVPPAQRRLQAVPDSGFVDSGIRSAQKQLQTWLAESGSQAGVIGVYGIGGVGKTSLLKIIYNAYKKEVSGLFDVCVWVTVSGSFEIEQFQVSIAEALNLSLEGTSTNETRKMKLNAALERKRCLLILDNMSNEIDLNEVGVKIGDDNGNKLLISSHRKEVIEKMGAKNNYSLEMQPLSSEECWDLFRRRAFTGGVVPENNIIKDIARKIVSACKGLPLVINAVAAAMSLKKTEDEWENALKKMGTRDPSFFTQEMGRGETAIDAELYPLLRWGYDCLPDSHLKNCFLYCAAFPGEKEILVDTLMQMWDAEGLLNEAGTTGRHCISELVSRCLVERMEYIVDDDYHSVEYLKIHEILRDMAVYTDRHQSKDKCLFLAGQKLQKFPSETDARDYKRISVGHNAIKDLPTDFKFSRLESLVLASNIRLEEVPQGFLSNIKSLKVFDLSCTSIRTLPIKGDQLQQLEFLNLAGCTKLVDLPDSLCSLSSLQVLNLSSCLALRSLPSRIGELTNLKHLKLDACYSLNGLPQNLSQLISLKTLILPLMESICAMSVQDLSKLSNLTELTTVIKSEKVGTMNTWKEMTNLTLEYGHDADADRDAVTPEHVILQNMGNMNKLQSFHLINYQGETLPSSIFEFENMKVLLLHSCYQLKELPGLDKIRSESAGDSVLDEIKSESAGDSVLDEIESESAGDSSPILENLVLKNLLSLKSIAGPFGMWDFKLQLLVIVNCPLLEKLPPGMNLPHLKELSITMCNELVELDTGTGGFPMLEMLTLDELNKLESIAGPSGVWDEGTMSKLQILQVIDCPLLKTLPVGMEKLSTLRQINGELDWWQRITWPDHQMETSLHKLFMIV